MLVLALLLAVSDEDLPAKLRHLESAAEAWAPAPSLDGTRVAFLTTLFGTRQAASVAVDGGYPTQLTDEPGGVAEIRHVPFEPGQLVAVGLRDGRSLIALVRRSGSEAVVLADFTSARGNVLVSSDKPARFRHPRFSPDGRTLYFLTDAGRSTMGVDAVTVQDRSRKAVHAPPGNVEAFAVSEDGHRLVVAVESNGQDVFSLLDFPSLRAQPLAAPPSGALADGGLIWDRTG